MPSDSYAPERPDLFPEEVWFALAIFLAIIGFFHWGSFLRSRLARRCRPPKSADEEESAHTAPAPQRTTGWSLSRIPLAVVNVFRVVAFRWALEWGPFDLRVVDIVLTLAYIAFLLAWTFVGDEDLKISLQSVFRWGSRAGLLAASQFPLVTALGTKNNIVSLVTGIGHDKLNFFHRVAARSCFCLLLLHVGGMLYSTGSFIQELLKMTWIRFGITALAALTILLFVSLRWIRARAYEVFFYSHFIAVFIFLLGAYFHTRRSGVSYWIWPCFMFWALDRFMRLSRVVVFNHLYFGFNRNAARLQDATTELLSDDFVRLRVYRPPHFQWSPGQTAYLVVPSVSAFPLEAHPFSISSVDSALFRSASAQNGTRPAPPAHGWKELVFLINVRQGFTKRLKAAAAQNRSVKVLIDGPYGSAPDMAAYDTAILVAGGSGVTYTLPVFLSAIEAARTGTSRCRRVVFIWAVRDASHVDWISDALAAANALAPSWLAVSVRIFFTRGMGPDDTGALASSLLSSRSALVVNKDVVDPESPAMGGDEDEQLAQSSSWKAQTTLKNVRIERGRPDVSGMLWGEVETASGSLSVTVCGSQSLTRAVRRALRFPVSGPASVLSGGPSVTLYVESFGYA